MYLIHLITKFPVVNNTDYVGDYVSIHPQPCNYIVGRVLGNTVPQGPNLILCRREAIHDVQSAFVHTTQAIKLLKSVLIM